jgi:hypothetical protein
VSGIFRGYTTFVSFPIENKPYRELKIIWFDFFQKNINDS